MFKNKLLNSLVGAVIVGIIEIINIYFVEIILHSYLEKKNIIQKGSLQVVIGSIAAILSIFTAFILERTLNIVKHPFVDSFGIFVGLMFYLFLNKIKRKIRSTRSTRTIKNDNKDKKDKNDKK